MKPMLAVAAKEIIFPCFASAKIDGVRAYVKDGCLISRSGKLIRNDHIQRTLGRRPFDGLDGELCVGNPWDPKLMQQTTSGVMSEDGMPQFTFQVFDIWNFAGTFEERFGNLAMALLGKTPWSLSAIEAGIRLVPHFRMRTMEELNTFEETCLKQGYEGVMVRSFNGPYKQGRSTAKEGYLLKVKRWTDGEARIVDLKQFRHNANEAFTGELGQTKRSTNAENMVAMEMLGSFICEDIVTGQAVDIGTGFTMEQRKQIWATRKDWQGKIVKYKHFAVTGVKDAPRFPVFMGFRHEDDMDAKPMGSQLRSIISGEDMS